MFITQHQSVGVIHNNLRLKTDLISERKEIRLREKYKNVYLLK